MVKFAKTEVQVKDQNLTPEMEQDSNNEKALGLECLTEITGIDAGEYPNEVFLYILLSKKILPLNDLLDATGLSQKKCSLVFEEDHCEDGRNLRTDKRANEVLAKHLEREDLEPHQYAICELLWRRMQFFSIQFMDEQFTTLTGRSLMEDYPEDMAFREESYDITAEELNEAVMELFLHLEDNAFNNV